MIVKMKKLTLAAHKSDIDALCSELMWLEAVETENVDAGKEAYSDNADYALSIYEKEQKLSRLALTIETLAPYGSGKKKATIGEAFTRKEFESLSELVPEAENVSDKCAEITADAARIRAKINRIENEIASLAPFRFYDEPASFDGTKNVLVVKGTFPKLVKIENVRGILDADGFDYELCFLCEEGDYKYVYAVIMKTDAESFLKKINAEGFSRIILSGYEGTAAEEIVKLEKSIQSLEKELENCKARYKELAKERRTVEMAYDYLCSQLDKDRIKQKLYSTESVGLLTGWVPVSKEEMLENKLAEFDCSYMLEEPADDEKVPVQLKNNGFASPFESVLGLYSYPDYKGIDPTFVMSIFYFLIFGLIMQDVVYGAILLFGCKAMIKILHAKEGSGLYKMLNMFSICGISTIVCGVLFGGYFGDFPSAVARNMFGIELPELAVAFNPVTNPMPYLILSLGIGVVHLVAGMLVKAYMLIKEGKALDALFDIGFWLVLFAGIGLLFVSADIGKWVAIAGALGLILTQGRAEKNIIMKFLKGVMSLYDIINYISDLLSYSRIMALGLSGAIIAQVVNTIGTLGGPSVVGILVLLLATLLGHTLNLALNVLGAFVHTARLQYIEFLGKFYVDGGEPFKPERVKTKYTEIIKEVK